MSIEAMRNAVEAMDKRDYEMADHILCQAIEQAERFDKQPTKILSTEEVLNSAGFYKAEKQEPVAWVTDLEFDGETELIPARRKGQLGTDGMDIPLYAQPKREWVGLTKEEVKEISFANRPYVVDMVVALEAKLKEKNT